MTIIEEAGTVDDEALWAAIEAERLSLANLLEDLDPGQWEARSLCSEWRVR
ncbi:maleylpyruvate isomerase family mycothiol-dependent enzyme, partial [Arthrobacter deserti]|nr:maleylpyruvate isomerase family mycothiol-dependent enzyme [Arthrobacter deserti]